MNEIEAFNMIELSRFLIENKLFSTIAFEYGIFAGDAKELSERFEFDDTELNFDLLHGLESVSQYDLVGAAVFLGMRKERFYRISQFKAETHAEAFCKIDEVFREMTRIFGNKYTAMVMQSQSRPGYPQKPGNYEIFVMPTIWDDGVTE